MALCRILDMNFREFLLPELGWIGVSSALYTAGEEVLVSEGEM